MTPAEAEFFNALQQTLKAILIGLVSETGVDPSKLAVILTAQATRGDLPALTQAMLHDLATGLAMMDKLGGPPVQ